MVTTTDQRSNASVKRDMDLVRGILMQLEDAPFDGGPLRMTIQSDRSPEEITYHIMLLHEAGLIKAFDFSTDEMRVGSLGI